MPVAAMEPMTEYVVTRTALPMDVEIARIAEWMSQ
mgnify:CR=1 FL=1